MQPERRSTWAGARPARGSLGRGRLAVGGCTLALAVLTQTAAPASEVGNGATPSDADVAAARAVLDGWQATDPEPGERLLHVIAWRARDRGFPAHHQARLDRIMSLVQTFYRNEMERHGFGPRSIRLDRAGDERLVVHEVVGEGTWDDYDVSDGRRIREECMPALRRQGIDLDRETVMIFTNLSDWDPERGRFRHKSPYYAGGDWQRGTAWQLDSPELDTTSLPLTEPLIEDGQYGRISLGKHNSIFIGGIAHELGHALGLPHCRERADEAVQGTALMGSGNQTFGDELRGEGPGSFLTRAHAVRLASHPQFSGSIKGLATVAEGTFSELAVDPIAAGRAFRLTGRVRGEPPVYAVVAYLDPEGHGDYDARTVSTVPDAAGRFTLDCTPLMPGTAAALRLVACHANGGTTDLQQPYGVAEDGAVDVVTMGVMFELSGFLDALARGGLERAAALAPTDGPAARCAAAVLAGRAADRQATPPAQVGADVDRIPLSQTEPAEAVVGWLQPAYDHLPRRDALIESAGRLYEHGIYAHAPARHRYELAGRWLRLRGGCGLPTQPGGSVVFVIRGDGRELYRSSLLRPGGSARYDLDLTGVEILELITEDAGDGKGGDWGLWLAPELSR